MRERRRERVRERNNQGKCQNFTLNKEGSAKCEAAEMMIRKNCVQPQFLPLFNNFPEWTHVLYCTEYHNIVALCIPHHIKQHGQI